MIAHLDIDAFFAAVEIHRRPELRGRPMVVGGDPHGRGVVATASYAARAFGIRSAMSCAEALRRCPQVVFVRPDIAHYREWSARVWELVRAMSPAVEVLGLDEGYLELPDEGAGEAADAVRRAVAERVRLSCSLGVATCKVVAKVASDRTSPAASRSSRPARRPPSWRRCRCGRCPGIGPRTEQRLAAAGLATVGDLAALDDDGLRALAPGRMGEDLRRRARGIDPRPRGGRARRAHLDLQRADLRARRLAIRGARVDRPRRWPTRWPLDPAPARPGGPHGDGQAALRRLPDHHPRPDRAGAPPTTRPSSGTPPAPCCARALSERDGSPPADGRGRVGAGRGAAAHPLRGGSRHDRSVRPERVRARLAERRAARAALEARAAEVDDLNVFPVADGDTGSNMLAHRRRRGAGGARQRPGCRAPALRRARARRAVGARATAA